MEFDIDYYVQNVITSGGYNPTDSNPCFKLWIDYGNTILKAARRHGYAQVESLKIDVDDLDDFQFFFIDGEEVTTTQWQEALFSLLSEALEAAYKE